MGPDIKMGIRVEYNKNWWNVDQICKVRQEKENGGGGAEGGVRGFRLPFVKKEFWLFHKIKSTKKKEKQNPKKKKKKTCQSHRPLSCGAFHVMKFNKPIKLFFSYLFIKSKREARQRDWRPG